ncbi:HNH endonuclease signature motif containing protein [Pseudolysinimonas yzui]|uniref:HNH nuclease domain-containing protein n=1 Tax=Pseudolysinimonas yzui TaxID=2708254 RepID=A0A8J3GPS4_9MICO|nr:HNH endonuclease signature motif containing protein [Pseudolysinimonas yzui]GHF11719.1 hypothetical protein GCM10011600_11330 [Pseudolysinimonas yzui]
MTSTSALATAVAVLRDVPRSVSSCRAASDASVMEWLRLAGEAKALADAHLALAAGELRRRSSPELGGAGLARREGARTPEELLKVVSGVTGRDAVVALRVGRLAQSDDAVPGDERSGDRVLGDRVVEGSVSVQAAEAIRAGLDGAAADPVLVAEATELLCDEAPNLDPDRLLKRAREVRDEIDEAGIASREAVLRGRRSLRRLDLRDGMKRLIWDYDPLTAGVVDEVYDRATSPRRGGPRFVDAESERRAEALERDERTTEQIASDAFTELLRQSAGLDPSVLLGRGMPAVRVLVSASDLAAGVGHGVIEGSNEAVSIGTVQALACANGTQPALLDSLGNVLDLGREQRLFSRHQRVALAIRDGGCLWHGCERPPSWCEAHHIDHYADGGCTDLDRGVLLCRHHHLKLHNEGWQIRRREGRSWLHPPPDRPRPPELLVTKSRAIREHQVRQRGSVPGPALRSTPGRLPAGTEHQASKIRR